MSETILDTVLTWEGVTLAPHRFSGIEFRIDHREIGHLHGNYQADIPFSARLRKESVASGRASLHHIYPNSGWVSFYVRHADDVSVVSQKGSGMVG
jgi:hypothetical protein